MPTTPATTLARRTRLRATATAGGLAVLLGGSLVGHLPAATAAVATTATSAASATGTLGAGLSAVTGTVGAVARTGGQR
ncbi:hypothetical protein [Lapillicoccus jejuensis]|uniref:Uncharacterized protein n=1 Tax=Lapillicoccus jejuensis TaxID=402171 RepID=A0A542DY88_9MICO|nr:hypothetical protein [Lapillicoccus jejuensis]TQJ08019.1 hypothetical protein FB458_1097 [Lapillicoccus jejuensis]